MLTSKVSESIRQIRTFTDKEVEIGLILGSGLAPIADRLENKVVIPYRDIPHFKESTAPGHEGRFIFGDLGGVPLLCMQGRPVSYTHLVRISFFIPSFAITLMG